MELSLQLVPQLLYNTAAYRTAGFKKTTVHYWYCRINLTQHIVRLARRGEQ